MVKNNQARAMIIGMGLLLTYELWALQPVHAAERLPDATTFAVRLEAGDVSSAREWLTAGLPASFEGSRIGTGLMIGAWEGNFELMSLFLQHGADINAFNSQGESALALAAWKGRQDVVDWLLERGAKLNPPDRHWSPLHYAVFAGHKELAQSLIARGAEIDAVSTNGSSSLMLAIYEGHEDLVRVLLEKGADRSIRNDWGDGGLEWAMRFDRLKLARMITSPQEFNIAVSEPRQKWGPPKRSVFMSAELEKLLRIRETMVDRGMDPKNIDNRIAAERARIVRREFSPQALPPRATALEITASRKQPRQQSAKLVPEGEVGQEKRGFKVPPVTYSGQPKMPASVPTKNY